MGSKTRTARRNKHTLAVDGIIFKLFTELKKLEEAFKSFDKRLASQDCYLARLEKLFVEKKLFTEEEVSEIAKLAIKDMEATTKYSSPTNGAPSVVTEQQLNLPGVITPEQAKLEDAMIASSEKAAAEPNEYE